MQINKLAPWNWFKKEQEQEAKSLPVVRREAQTAHPDSIFRIHREINRMFDDVFRNFGLPGMGYDRPGLSTAQAEWLKPTLDVGASDNEYTISVELPGVNEKDVQLELVGDTLRLKGEKKQEKEEKERDYYRIERSYGSFQRVLSLPEDAEQGGITASYKNGVMTIRVPRKSVEKPETKQIEIKTG